MINSVSSISNLYPTSAAPAAKTPSTSKPDADPPQDTIQLSPAALAAAGDIDHDGDSH